MIDIFALKCFRKHFWTPSLTSLSWVMKTFCGTNYIYIRIVKWNDTYCVESIHRWRNPLPTWFLDSFEEATLPTISIYHQEQNFFFLLPFGRQMTSFITFGFKRLLFLFFLSLVLSTPFDSKSFWTRKRKRVVQFP